MAAEPIQDLKPGMRHGRCVNGVGPLISATDGYPNADS